MDTFRGNAAKFLCIFGVDNTYIALREKWVNSRHLAYYSNDFASVLVIVLTGGGKALSRTRLRFATVSGLCVKQYLNGHDLIHWLMIRSLTKKIKPLGPQLLRIGSELLEDYYDSIGPRYG